MAEKLDPKELVSFKEMLLNEVITSEAIINLLDRKGIISKQELMEEIKRVQASMLKTDK
ncbi:MAG: hypothetical protein ABSG75_10690 [Syntrophales bacterium]|jgi:hypothetical protein